MIDLYPLRVYPVKEADGIEWIAEYPDLPGCIGVGDSREDALREGEANKTMWLDSARIARDPIPKPSLYGSEEYSGRFNLRLPKSLHRDLAILAGQEEVSLNTLCIKLLAESIANRIRYNTTASGTISVTVAQAE